MWLHAQIMYCIYITFTLCQYFFSFLSGAFTAESIWQLQLLLNITGKIGSTWDLNICHMKNLLQKMYFFPVFLFLSIHSIHSISGFLLNVKKRMQFKKQETHNRIKQMFKLLWWQQNFHRNVQHWLIAAFLSMCWLIQFLLFQ